MRQEVSAHAPPRTYARARCHRRTGDPGNRRPKEQAADIRNRRGDDRRHNDAGEYSGVYLKARNGARKVASVKFSSDYAGDTAGGAPRFTIPIDTDHDRTVDAYAFVDAINCGDHGTVSTTDADCKVFIGSEVFDNWAAFVAAHPTYRVPPRAIPFIIADQPGNYEIMNIDLR